jgi:hypothetical protein
LRDILRVGLIAQDSTCHPEGKRAALLDALLKLAPSSGFFTIERQLSLRCATGPGEFLHPLSPYNCQTPPPGFEFDAKPNFMMNSQKGGDWRNIAISLIDPDFGEQTAQAGAIAWLQQ